MPNLVICDYFSIIFFLIEMKIPLIKNYVMYILYFTPHMKYLFQLHSLKICEIDLSNTLWYVNELIQLINWLKSYFLHWIQISTLKMCLILTVGYHKLYITGEFLTDMYILALAHKHKGFNCVFVHSMDGFIHFWIANV